MDRQDHLIWHEVSPGRYERDLDELEMFYSSLAKTWEGSGGTYFAINGFLSITVPLRGDPSILIDHKIKSAFRKAWKRLRYDHPTLAAPVEYDPETKRVKKVYRGLGAEGDGASWLNETFKIISNDIPGPEFANSDIKVGRCATLYLITPPHSNVFQKDDLRRDIVFRSSHDLIDGMGTLTLLNNLLRHASAAYASQIDHPDTVFGDEYKNLSPPFRIAAALPAHPSPAQAQKLQWAREANAAAREATEAIAVPVKLRTDTPGKSRRVAIHLTELESARVLEKSKRLGASVTHTFHAGIALTVRNLQERRESEWEGVYISYALTNLRGVCQPPYNYTLHAAAVYHGVSVQSLFVPVTIPAASDAATKQSTAEFSEVLETVRSFYKGITYDSDELSIMPSIFASNTPPYPATSCPVPAPNAKPSASLSSFGIVDKIIQPEYPPFVVSEPWVTGSEYTTGLGVYLATWKGVIALSAAYNDAFHTEGEVVGFLEHVKQVVLQGLDL